MYIEADVMSAHLAKRLLTARDYQFVHAANGLDGIDIAGQEEPALGSFNGIDRRGFQNSLQDVKLCPKKPCLPAK